MEGQNKKTHKILLFLIKIIANRLTEIDLFVIMKWGVVELEKMGRTTDIILSNTKEVFHSGTAK